ncbi:unnamed protein product [Larinioides sclopetarius]|uniref:Uncharacterized protein n=1 Tax=Larinioides sclopetarius TaxID=280406 RepID=A0AAV1YTR8_9ARAC
MYPEDTMALFCKRFDGIHDTCQQIKESNSKESESLWFHHAGQFFRKCNEMKFRKVNLFKETIIKIITRTKLEFPDATTECYSGNYNFIMPTSFYPADEMRQEKTIREEWEDKGEKFISERTSKLKYKLRNIAGASTSKNLIHAVIDELFSTAKNKEPDPGSELELIDSFIKELS